MKSHDFYLGIGWIVLVLTEVLRYTYTTMIITISHSVSIVLVIVILSIKVTKGIKNYYKFFKSE